MFSCAIRPNMSHSLREDAEAGDAEAQFALGRHYMGKPQKSETLVDNSEYRAVSFTDAVPQDLPLATKWLRKAANQGHTEAARWLEALIAHPPGVY